MVNKIHKELKLAKEKTFKLIKGTNLVKLSIENVAIVEAMIQNDSAYIKSGDKNADPKHSKNNKLLYAGSTAYWVTQLKYFLENYKYPKYNYHTIISNIVNAIDRENSTHINADGCGREEITKRIVHIYPKDLKQKLKTGNLYVFNKIATRTSAKIRSRVNLSFASKFCHYVCFYIFEGEKEQDNYSIYDNVLKKALPLYVNQYGTPKRDLDNYEEYQKTIDEIIAKSKAKISRNGFDHLLWYYFKGRI